MESFGSKRYEGDHIHNPTGSAKRANKHLQVSVSDTNLICPKWVEVSRLFNMSITPGAP